MSSTIDHKACTFQHISALCPSIKTQSNKFNHRKLNARTCENGDEDSKDKSSSESSRVCLVDSVRFDAAARAYFLLWTQAAGIVNFFQNTFWGTDDEVSMPSPPCYKEWFKSRYPSVEFLTAKQK